MGCVGSKVDPKAKAAAAVSEKIERQLRQDRKNEESTVKMLLLGR